VARKTPTLRKAKAAPPRVSTARAGHTSNPYKATSGRLKRLEDKPGYPWNTRPAGAADLSDEAQLGKARSALESAASALSAAAVDPEPVFTVRAGEALAVEWVLAWAKIQRDAGNFDAAERAARAATRMSEWRQRQQNSGGG
jgi:hypothetical protein